MLKTEIVELPGSFPGRQLVISGSLPACADEDQFEQYREDARRMLSRLARDFNALGVQQVLAAAVEIVATREGHQWLIQECAAPKKRAR